MIEAALGRLGALRSELLGRDVFETLLGASDEGAALGVLGGTAYADAIRRAKARAGERSRMGPEERLESELWAEVFSSWGKLVKFLEGALADLARLLAGSFEIENVRRTVRRVTAGLARDEAPPLFKLGRPLGAARPGRLESALSIEQVAGALDGTVYQPMFDRASHHLVSGGALFSFEQALEVAYREALSSTARKVGGDHGRSAREYLDPRQHFATLRWALRLRFGRRMSPEESRRYLPVTGGPEETAEVSRVVSADSLPAAAAELGRVLGREAGRGASLRDLHRALTRAAARLSRREVRRGFQSFSGILAYFDVRVQEVREIATIMTGHRLGRGPDEVRPLLSFAA